MKKIIFLAALLCAIMLLISGCEQKESITPSGKTIKIGIIGPMSGKFLAQGVNGVEGIKAAMKVQPLLHNGDALELVIEDDGDEPTQTISALRKLAEIEKVAAILCFSDSASVLAMEPFVDRYKIPVVAILATHPEVAKHSEYTTQLCFDDIFQGSVAALFVRDELLIERVAIMDNPDNPYSIRLAAEFRRKFESTGGQITAIVNVSDGVDDVPAIMESLKIKKTQLVYMPIKAESLIKLVKAIRKIHWHPKLMSSDGLLATVLSRFQGDVHLLEGLMATEFFGERKLDSLKTDYERELLRAYDSLFDHPPTSYSGLGAEAYAVLCDAFNRSRDLGDRSEINNKLKQTKDFPGISGRISITASGKSQRTLYVDSIKNGSLKVLVKVY